MNAVPTWFIALSRLLDSPIVRLRTIGPHGSSSAVVRCARHCEGYRVMAGITCASLRAVTSARATFTYSIAIQRWALRFVLSPISTCDLSLGIHLIVPRLFHLLPGLSAPAQRVEAQRNEQGRDGKPDEDQCHAASCFSGRAMPSGQFVPAGQLSENHRTPRSKFPVVTSPPSSTRSKTPPPLKTIVLTRERESLTAVQ